MDGKVNGFIEVLDPTVTESGEWDFGSVYLLSRRAGFSGCHAFAHGHGDGHHLLRLDDHGTRGECMWHSEIRGGWSRITVSVTASCYEVFWMDVACEWEEKPDQKTSRLG